MSSTNRGAERQQSDYYVTPIDDVCTFLREWPKDNPLLATEVFNVWDPCAGGTRAPDGSVAVPMSYPTAIHKCVGTFGPEAVLRTSDIREDSLAANIENFLTIPIPSRQPDVIITNPPFNIAQAIITKALDVVRPGGWVVMLLRLNFMGSKERKEWFQNHMPEWLYVHSKRMGFKKHLTHLPKKERDQTDSIEYAHFVWRSGYRPATAKMRVI